MSATFWMIASVLSVMPPSQPESVSPQRIARLTPPRALAISPAGAGPAFLAPRPIAGQPRNPVDPRSPYYHPSYSR